MQCPLPAWASSVKEAASGCAPENGGCPAPQDLWVSQGALAEVAPLPDSGATSCHVWTWHLASPLPVGTFLTRRSFVFLFFQRVQYAPRGVSCQCV